MPYKNTRPRLIRLPSRLEPACVIALGRDTRSETLSSILSISPPLQQTASWPYSQGRCVVLWDIVAAPHKRGGRLQLPCARRTGTEDCAELGYSFLSPLPPASEWLWSIQLLKCFRSTLTSALVQAGRASGLDYPR